MSAGVGWERDPYTREERYTRAVGPVKLVVRANDDKRVRPYEFWISAGGKQVAAAFGADFATAELARLGAEAAAYRWLKDSLDMLGDER